MDTWTVVLITSASGLVSGVVGAGVNTWLANRSKVTEELRDQRLKAYPDVWERTGRFARWPRNSVTYAALDEFHRELRTWYFHVGGLYMSENARGRYGRMQELVAAHCAVEESHASLPPDAYADIMETCSEFRTALTEDLESRRQGSLVYSLQKAREHRRMDASARSRLRRAARAPEAEVAPHAPPVPH
jgi:hypothetical protein